VLGVEGLRIVRIGLRIDRVVPPEIAALGPRHVQAGAAHDEHVLEGGQISRRLIGDRFHLDPLAAAVLPVARHEQLRPGVLEAEAHGLSREPAEDERVHGADPRAGERDHHGLDEHRQVDDHAVARFDAERGEPVRGARHAALQLGVGDRLAVARLALEEQRDLVAPPGRDVPVDAVGGDVEPAAGEPRRLGNAQALGVAVLAGNTDRR
jgi:hypothetical protein